MGAFALVYVEIVHRVGGSQRCLPSPGVVSRLEIDVYRRVDTMAHNPFRHAIEMIDHRCCNFTARTDMARALQVAGQPENARLNHEFFARVLNACTSPPGLEMTHHPALNRAGLPWIIGLGEVEAKITRRGTNDPGRTHRSGAEGAPRVG
jgi:hypothetical protein